MPTDPSSGAAGSPFAVALAESLRARDLTGGQLCAQLATVGASLDCRLLAQWLDGSASPRGADELRTLVHIERLLGERQGTLFSALVPLRPFHSETRDVDPPDALYPPGRQVADAMAELGMGEHADLVGVSIERRIHIDASGRECRVHAREVLQALVDGGDFWAAVYRLDEPADRAPEVQAVEGCWVGAAVFDDRLGLTVARMRLGAEDEALVLRAGERTTVEYEVEIPPIPSRTEQYVESCYDRRHRVDVVVSFTPPSLPETVECFATVNETEVIWDAALDAHHEVRLGLREFGPGTCGIRWQWPVGPAE